jgi:REP element-mobilizing transposase RayT
MSKVQNIMHIVINTKYRRMTINEANKKQLYYFMWGVMKKLRCHLIWMNGIPNHIHILVDLHPQISLSLFVQEIKRSSNIWIKKSGLFPDFEAWGSEYCAFSKNKSDIPIVKNYIKNQEKHHLIASYDDEMTTLLSEIDMEWHPEQVEKHT